MLGKLLKYELKATGRIFLLVYLGLFVIALISSFTLRSDIQIIQVIFGFLLFALYTALLIVTIVLLIQRFYQNFLKDEGYLMFTLPVTPTMLITSKLIAACIWCILSMFVGAVAALIVIQGFFDMATIMNAITEFMSELVTWGFAIPASVVVLIILSCLAQLVFSILHVYLSLAIGQLPPFGKYKILFSVIAYLVISVVVSIISSVVTTIAGAYFYRHFSTIEMAFNAYGMPIMSDIWTVINQFLIGATIFNLILAVAAFVGTSLILQKKLNLE